MHERPVQKVASELLPIASVFVTEGTGVVALAAGQLAGDRARGPPAVAVMAVVDGTEALLALSHHFLQSGCGLATASGTFTGGRGG